MHRKWVGIQCWEHLNKCCDFENKLIQTRTRKSYPRNCLRYYSVHNPWLQVQFLFPIYLHPWTKKLSHRAISRWNLNWTSSQFPSLDNQIISVYKKIIIGKKITYRRGGNSGATAEGFEASINDLSSLLVDLNLQLHDIPTGWCTYEPRSHCRIVLIEGTDVTGVIKVIYHVLVVETR